MDRLQTVSALACVLAALGCDEGSGQGASTTAPISRVESISAPKNQASESDLCDVVKPAESAPMFAYPPLDTSAPPTAGWRWINVWASWCGPCVEEMPLIARLRDDLRKDGVKVELVLLSVDQTAEAMSGFLASHPEAKGSLRLSEFKALEGWLSKVGLDAGATLPIHLFVDPNGKVRCARTGAVRETDLPLLKKVLSG